MTGWSTSGPPSRCSGSRTFPTAEAFRDYFKINYGPTIAVYRSLADQPERQAALDHDLAELGRRFAAEGDGELIMDWEYLLVTAVVA